MKWLQIWSRMGKQPIKKVRDMNVVLKEDGQTIPLRLVFDKSGNYWWLEKEKGEENE